jgi:paraquat-inducible protein B
VKFKGVEMGKVSGVSLTEDKKKVAVTVDLPKSAESLARKQSKFWLVKPKVSATGVSGVETLLSGMYIAVLPGGGSPAHLFSALDDGPILDQKADDLVVVLKADRLGSLSPGCPIYYRQVQVGLISETRLSKQSDSVLIFARIQRNYAPLVHNGTVFWNVSGVGVDLGLFGSKIKTESLSSLLTGGVAFATPEGDAMGAPAKRGDVFPLHSDPDDDWLKWAPKINIKPANVTS